MNTQNRNCAADLLKGTAVVLMIQVHIVELFAQPSVLENWIGRASLFLGGPPVAPVLIAVMGYFAGRPCKSRRSAIGSHPAAARARPRRRGPRSRDPACDAGHSRTGLR